MEVSHYPDRLKNLAVEAAGKLVTELFKHILKCEKHTRISLRRPNYVVEACNQFRDLYVRIVPLCLAHEMTVKLLRHLEFTYRRLRIIESTPIEGIASEILCAIIHPHVLELEFRQYTSHPTPIDLYKTGASRFVFMTIPKLKQLRTLKLGWSGNIPKLKLSSTGGDLEKFSYLECDDDDMFHLAYYCTQLKSLDLTLAANVTDNSLSCLTMFKHLTELNVSGTKITQEGMTRLLTAFVWTPVAGNGSAPRKLSEQLTGFGCDEPLTSHIDLLAREFWRLRSLTFNTVGTGIEMTRLGELKFLKHFAIGSFGVSKEFLQFIGRRLECLDIALYSLTELTWIHNCCPSLECLHLYFRIPEEPQPALMTYFQRFPLPEFQSVKYLQLILFNQDITDYVVSRFVNVRKLYISHDGRESLFEDIVQRKRLKGLEQFFWGDNTLVEFSGDKAIITRVDGESISVHSAQSRGSFYTAWQ
jgi:hypothetical protein